MTHLFVMFARRIWERMIFVRPTKLERMLEESFQRGRSDAFTSYGSTLRLPAEESGE